MKKFITCPSTIICFTASLILINLKIVNAQTLQTVTNNGNISTRDNSNIIFQKATAGAGSLFLQFNNSDGTRRGYIGYGSSTLNRFYIFNDDGSPTSISNPYVNKQLSKGTYTLNWQPAINITSGIYYCVIQTDSFKKTIKLDYYK